MLIFVKNFIYIAQIQNKILTIMMQTTILPIIFGINGSGLNGCINDAILIYNLFQSYHITNNNLWLIPHIFTESEANLDSIIHILQENKFTKLIFYYSGHGYSGGRIELGQPLKIYQFISNHINQDIELTYILDCCHGGSFPILTEFANIKKTTIIASCNSSQSSTESLSDDSNKYFIFKKPNYTKSPSYIIGLFTFNMIDIIRKNNLTIWDDFYSNPIWKDIEFIAKQSITIKN